MENELEPVDQYSGLVGSTRPDLPQKTYFSIGLIGLEVEKMRLFLLGECRKRGLNPLETTVTKEKDGRSRVSIRVESDIGIV